MFFVFFFFKQKTAYEMRISDWSSDVCSSDLPAFDVPSLADEIVRGVVMADPLDILFDDRAFVQIGGDIMGGRADHLDATRVGLMIGLCPLEAGEEDVLDVDAAPCKIGDRKSVVSGKSGSWRVDLGGRHIIKKKKETQRN